PRPNPRCITPPTSPHMGGFDEEDDGIFSVRRISVRREHAFVRPAGERPERSHVRRPEALGGPRNPPKPAPAEALSDPASQKAAFRSPGQRKSTGSGSRASVLRPDGRIG